MLFRSFLTVLKCCFTAQPKQQPPTVFACPLAITATERLWITWANSKENIESQTAISHKEEMHLTRIVRTSEISTHTEKIQFIPHPLFPSPLYGRRQHMFQHKKKQAFLIQDTWPFKMVFCSLPSSYFPIEIISSRKLSFYLVIYPN